jgi:hypothetical protein
MIVRQYLSFIARNEVLLQSHRLVSTMQSASNCFRPRRPLPGIPKSSPLNTSRLELVRAFVRFSAKRPIDPA